MSNENLPEISEEAVSAWGGPRLFGYLSLEQTEEDKPKLWLEIHALGSENESLLKKLIEKKELTFRCVASDPLYSYLVPGRLGSAAGFQIEL